MLFSFRQEISPFLFRKLKANPSAKITIAEGFFWLISFKNPFVVGPIPTD
jgi:hypothetical protein